MKTKKTKDQSYYGYRSDQFKIDESDEDKNQ